MPADLSWDADRGHLRGGDTPSHFEQLLGHRCRQPPRESHGPLAPVIHVLGGAEEGERPGAELEGLVPSRGFVGNTDHDWYVNLRARPELDEVNFWFPGERQRFAGLRAGEPFFFKLKAPYDAIAGFGQFSRFEWMPVWLAWEVFGEANGVSNEQELSARLARLHAGKRRTDRIGSAASTATRCQRPDGSSPLRLNDSHVVERPRRLKARLAQSRRCGQGQRWTGRVGP